MTHRKSCGARPSGLQRPQLSLSVPSYQNPLTKSVQRNLDRKFSCWDNKNRKPQNVLNCCGSAIVPMTGRASLPAGDNDCRFRSNRIAGLVFPSLQQCGSNPYGDSEDFPRESWRQI